MCVRGRKSVRTRPQKETTEACPYLCLPVPVPHVPVAECLLVRTRTIWLRPDFFESFSEICGRVEKGKILKESCGNFEEGCGSTGTSVGINHHYTPYPQLHTCQPPPPAARPQSHPQCHRHQPSTIGGALGRSSLFSTCAVLTRWTLIGITFSGGSYSQINPVGVRKSIDGKSIEIYAITQKSSKGKLRRRRSKVWPEPTRASLRKGKPEVEHTSGFTTATGCPRWGHHSPRCGWYGRLPYLHLSEAPELFSRKNFSSLAILFLRNFREIYSFFFLPSPRAAQQLAHKTPHAVHATRRPARLRQHTITNGSKVLARVHTCLCTAFACYPTAP